MKVTLHLPMSLPGGIAYDFTTPAELRDFLSRLTSPEGYADDSPSTVTLSADAAYMPPSQYAGKACRGPMKSGAQCSTEQHNQITERSAVAAHLLWEQEVAG